jgi:HEAT repeat protein
MDVYGPGADDKVGSLWDSRCMVRKSIAGITPRERIESECARRGADAVAADCIALLSGSTDLNHLNSLAGPGADRYFDGEEHQDTYWFRVWALRGLLYSWTPKATRHLCAALSDESWRVREMAAKVVAKHLVAKAAPQLAQLRDDPVPRVRQAAERAQARLISAGA